VVSGVVAVNFVALPGSQILNRSTQQQPGTKTFLSIKQNLAGNVAD